ncbi:MAG: hypothetical protein ACYSSI_11290 [Planctomycetota bacterium]|jgi:hypothetical protein
MTSSKTNSFAKACLIVELLLICVLICGCEETQQVEPIDKSAVNAELINTFNDISMENAIIAQHTLYPYHFVQNGEQLNELGKRDLSILAAHLKDYPGQLNVRRDGITGDLYQARVTYTLEQLRQAGVDSQRVSVSDGMPGGSGMFSEQVINILESDEKARSSRREKYPTTQNKGGMISK